MRAHPVEQRRIAPEHHLVLLHLVGLVVLVGVSARRRADVHVARTVHRRDAQRRERKGFARRGPAREPHGALVGGIGRARAIAARARATGRAGPRGARATPRRPPSFAHKGSLSHTHTPSPFSARSGVACNCHGACPPPAAVARVWPAAARAAAAAAAPRPPRPALPRRRAVGPRVALAPPPVPPAPPPPPPSPRRAPPLPCLDLPAPLNSF